MGRILLIDDDQSFVGLLQAYINENFPNLQLATCTDPVAALGLLQRDLDLLLIDLEMPRLDGTKLLRYATSAGVDKNRIIILSGRDADYLHQRFPMGSCLAVLNKYEVRQKDVLDMVFRAIQAAKGSRSERVANPA